MKLSLFAVPVTIALLAGAAGAQTTAATSNFGSTWSATNGDKFFTDTTMATLKTDDEVRSAWDALPEADRTMISDDCKVLRDAAAAGSGTDAATSTMTDGAMSISQENATKLCDIVAPAQ